MSYLAPWNKGSLVNGVGYAECTTYQPLTYPNSQTINWSWPETPPPTAGVYNFLSVNFGNYDWTTVLTPVTPKEVGSISTLAQTFNLSIQGEVQGFDVIEDLFLTSEAYPNGTNPINKKHEIEIFLHSPAYSIAYASSLTPIGTFIASGIQWTASINKNMAVPSVLIMPTNHTDALVGTVDIHAIFTYLIAKKIISNTEYFNGLGLGVEVRTGSGALTIKSLSTTYNWSSNGHFSSL